MRHAPPVRVCGRGGRRWVAVQVALPALAAAVCVAWSWRHATAGDALSAVGVATVLAATVVAASAAWRWARPSVHELSWDGAGWFVDGTPAVVRPAIDLGGWLLLRWRADGDGGGAPAPWRGAKAAGGWVALTRAEAGGALHALRAAVYCPAPEPSPRPTEPRPPD